MNGILPIRRILCLSFAAGVLAAALPVCVTADELPEFALAAAIIEKHFASFDGHRPHDLISQSQAAPVFGQLEAVGWKVDDRAAILSSVLPNGHYLVAAFRTPEGRKFMRKVSSDDLAYDRLDQISQMPGGKLMIQDFFRFPKAELSFTSRSAVPIRDYARFAPPQDRRGAPTAADLDKPTRRIYTAPQLIARLQESYDAQVQRGKQP